MLKKIKEAVTFITERLSFKPEVAIVLGSGLGSLADSITDAVALNYSDIPNFPQSTVAGHAGRLVCGKLAGKYVAVMQGRFHYYEGYDMRDVTFPIRVMRGMGIQKLILTNAAGGLNPGLKAGDLMIITDHINMTGTNPLIGSNVEELGPRFPDMSEAYDRGFIHAADTVAERCGIEIKRGVYAGVSGPCYSTKAELRMLITIGADAIGMSTVPEAITAVHGGMRVLGITCITDSANPDNMEAPTHEEILKIAERARPSFIRLVEGVVGTL